MTFLKSFQAPISAILHPLASSLLQLLLPLALPSWSLFRSTIITATHSSQPTLHTHEGSVRQPHRVQRHNNPQPPRAVTKDTNSSHATPGPVHNIPHVLRQTRSSQIFPGGPQSSILAVTWSTQPLQVELDNQSWDCKREIRG